MPCPSSIYLNRPSTDHVQYWGSNWDLIKKRETCNEIRCILFRLTAYYSLAQAINVIMCRDSYHMGIRTTKCNSNAIHFQSLTRSSLTFNNLKCLYFSSSYCFHNEIVLVLHWLLPCSTWLEAVKDLFSLFRAFFFFGWALTWQQVILSWSLICLLFFILILLSLFLWLFNCFFKDLYYIYSIQHMPLFIATYISFTVCKREQQLGQWWDLNSPPSNQ